MKLPVIAWEDVVNHPEVVEHQPIPFARMERIGDACASGGREMVIVPGKINLEAQFKDEDEMLCLYVDGELRDFVSFAGLMEYGHARVEHRDDESARVVVRTPSGEYSALPIVPGDMNALEIRHQWLEVFACLYQRGRVTRDTALALPAQAGALQRATSAGREMASRVDALVQRIRTPKLDRKVKALERVTVELAAPKGTRAMALRSSSSARRRCSSRASAADNAAPRWRPTVCARSSCQLSSTCPGESINGRTPYTLSPSTIGTLTTC